MSLRHVAASLLIVSCVLIGCATDASPKAVASSSTQPTAATQPFRYEHQLRKDPNQSLHFVEIDLTDQRVSVAVSRGGPDPDGDGKWTTTLLPVREIAEREAFDIAVNGDFFEGRAEKVAQGKSTGFVKGKWASPAGPAETDGTLWKPAPATRPALLVGDGKAAVEQVDPARPFPAWPKQAIGGNVVLVRDGKLVSHANMDRHPRTVAGVDKNGTKLILMVVDGRQKDLSIGMTYEELGREMLARGAWSAVNLDGGGSTTLIMRDATAGKLKVVNSPSDGKERAVADVLGVRIR